MEATLTREQILDRLCGLAAEQVEIERDKVTIDTHLIDDLGFDSLDAVDYVMKLEEEFEITIPDEQAEKVKTVRNVLDLMMPAEPTDS